MFLNHRGQCKFELRLAPVIRGKIEPQKIRLKIFLDFSIIIGFKIFYSVNIPFLIILSKILAQAISRAFLVAMDIVD
jgi:hypothetical protein